MLILQDIPERTSLGDIWQLGNHRLLCGDSTDILQVKRVMGGEKADITFTSPPYNMTNLHGKPKYFDRKKDNRKKKDYVSLLVDFTKNALEVSKYVFSVLQSVSDNKVAIIEYLYAMREKFADTIIWDKTRAIPAFPNRVLNSQFENIYVFSHEAHRAIGTRDFRGTLSNLIRLDSRKKKTYSKIHKAVFKVELPEMFLQNFSTSSCFDPFCGIGTTLIACENMNRKGYGIELDHRYCDVAIHRWEKHTGQKAKLMEA